MLLAKLFHCHSCWKLPLLIIFVAVAEVNELKDLTKIAEEKARVAEQMSSKFQNDAYRVQLEKIEIENELKFYKATR